MADDFGRVGSARRGAGAWPPQGSMWPESSGYVMRANTCATLGCLSDYGYTIAEKQVV